MQNQLLQCATVIFNQSEIFYHAERGATLMENFREKILELFDQFECAAFEKQIPTATAQQAKYALAAFFDELVLSSAWPGRFQWMGTPLQLQFFGEHLAGENFFQRLQILRQNPQTNIDLLEIFFLCLQFGFEGMYRLRGLEHLLTLQVDLHSQIEMVRGVVEPILSPAGLPKQNIVTNVGARLPYWAIVSMTAALIFFIFLGFTVTIDRQANIALKNINSSKNNLLNNGSPPQKG